MKKSTELEKWSAYSVKLQSYLMICLRIKSKLNKEEFSEVFGIKISTLAKIERGEGSSLIKPEFLLMLNKYFKKVDLMTFVSSSYVAGFHERFCRDNSIRDKEIVILNKRVNELMKAAYMISPN